MIIFFWVDEFACPMRFLRHTAKNMTMDPAPVADEFNAQDYATLVAHPSPFQKFLEEFLCLVGLSRHYTLDEETYTSFVDKDGQDMDIFSFIRTTDPTKVKVVERERREDEPQLLETTVGRIVPLLPVAPDHAESELDASVDKLFDEGGSGTQDVIPLQPRRQGKRKTIVSDAGGPSHPPKRLREDHGTPSGDSIGGKSRSAVQRLFVGVVQNAEVRGEPFPTLPFVTSSESTTPEREDEGYTDSVTGLNLRTISAPQRFVVSSDSSHHFGANIAEAEVDSFARPSVPVITTATTVTSTANPVVVVKEKVVKPSLFAVDSSSAGRADLNAGIFSDLTRSDFLVSGVRTVIDPDTDLQKVYVPRRCITNGSRLDDGLFCREMVDEFAPLKFFASVRGMEHDQLFTEFNVGAARQMSLSAEVREREIKNLKAKEAEAAEAIRLRAEASKFKAIEKSLQVEVEALKEHNTTLEKKKNELDVKVVDLAASVKVREQEIADLDVAVTSVKSQNNNLVNQLERFQDEKMKVVNDKFHKLYTDFIDMTLHLEERFYLYLLTTIAGRMWLLTYGMELAVAKYLNSSEYLSALGAAIGKAIEKGMQDGLAAGI
ncbi:hypothetical protein Tco_1183658, partial [Tanacetum coccineum]